MNRKNEVGGRWLVLVAALTVAANLHAQQLGSIKWGSSEPYDVGYNPSVTGSFGNYMLEVHNGQDGPGTMWYHVGQASYEWPSPSPSIKWSQYQAYDWRYNPSVAGCPQSNTVIEVHNGQGGPGPMWYHLGKVRNNTSISWAPPVEYDWGWNPSIGWLCLEDFNFLGAVEVHNGQLGFGTLFLHGDLWIPPGGFTANGK
jgi:hypothetical protein